MWTRQLKVLHGRWMMGTRVTDDADLPGVERLGWRELCAGCRKDCRASLIWNLEVEVGLVGHHVPRPRAHEGRSRDHSAEQGR